LSKVTNPEPAAKLRNTKPSKKRRKTVNEGKSQATVETEESTPVGTEALKTHADDVATESKVGDDDDVLSVATSAAGRHALQTLLSQVAKPEPVKPRRSNRQKRSVATQERKPSKRQRKNVNQGKSQATEEMAEEDGSYLTSAGGLLDLKKLLSVDPNGHDDNDDVVSVATSAAGQQALQTLLSKVAKPALSVAKPNNLNRQKRGVSNQEQKHKKRQKKEIMNEGKAQANKAMEEDISVATSGISDQESAVVSVGTGASGTGQRALSELLAAAKHKKR